MSKTNQFCEYDLLEVFVDEMESRGETRKLIQLSIDDAMVDRIRDKLGRKPPLDQLYLLADKCLANEWLEQKTMGGGKYAALTLSTMGFGVVRSRQRQKENLANRSFLKKASDYIEDHKGLMIALGSAVALAGLLLKLFWG